MSVKPRMLVVDDELDMIEFVERVFRVEFDVKRATSAAEALGMLAVGDIDVVVTDHKMPVMTGVEMLSRMRGETQLAKVMLSGYTDTADQQRAIEECGVHAFVQKPIDSEKLREAVHGARRLRDELLA